MAVWLLLILCCGVAAQVPPQPTPAAGNQNPAPKQPNNNPSKQDTPKKDGKQTVTPASQVGPSPAPQDIEDQSSVPLPPAPKEQTLTIDPPHFSDPLQYVWFGLMGIAAVSILALAFAAWRLKFAGSIPLSIDVLDEQVLAVRNRAVKARARFEEIVNPPKRPTGPSQRPEPQPQPQQPPQPQAPLSPVTREPLDPRPLRDPYGRDAGRDPGRQPHFREPDEPRPPRADLPPKFVYRGGGNRPESPPAPPPVSPPTLPPKPPSVAPRPPAPVHDEMVEAYNLARTDRNARDEFDSRYQYVRISCTNHEDWQYHKNVTLRFESSDYGWYLMVNRGGKSLAFPWFAQDLESERDSFSGVFQYPEFGGGQLRLVRPAVLQAQGDAWILTEPGEVRADA